MAACRSTRYLRGLTVITLNRVPWPAVWQDGGFAVRWRIAIVGTARLSNSNLKSKWLLISSNSVINCPLTFVASERTDPAPQSPQAMRGLGLFLPLRKGTIPARLRGTPDCRPPHRSAQQRQQALDVHQQARPEARQTKHDCRAANQKSNAACRQDKRHTKQDARKTAET
ncbi:hypothetical protein C7476_12444 [Phyllobacterium bourgognense]|uniref:Uncharacterized protein n=1 Tax=Phyllobacterium bourgognense TaxID=314236 RepID=A0A368YE46_9HYPH|nr:hypothetical protein C7476_12444 [Phyllobacterium bourgognense]